MVIQTLIADQKPYFQTEKELKKWLKSPRGIIITKYVIEYLSSADIKIKTFSDYCSFNVSGVMTDKFIVTIWPSNAVKISISSLRDVDFFLKLTDQMRELFQCICKITLEKSFMVTEETVSTNQPDIIIIDCPVCKGTGLTRDGSLAEECFSCKGNGCVELKVNLFRGLKEAFGVTAVIGKSWRFSSGDEDHSHDILYNNTLCKEPPISYEEYLKNRKINSKITDYLGYLYSQHDKDMAASIQKLSS